MAKDNVPPFDDKSMWRKLIVRCHPDTGGDALLFSWINALRDMVEYGGEIPKRRRSYGEPWDSVLDRLPDNVVYGHSPPASDKQIALIAHLSEMDADERRQFYPIAREFGLNKKQASVLIDIIMNKR